MRAFFAIRFSLRLDYVATNADASMTYRASQTVCDADNYTVEGNTLALSCSIATWPEYQFASVKDNRLRVNGLDFTHNKPF